MKGMKLSKTGGALYGLLMVGRTRMTRSFTNCQVCPTRHIVFSRISALHRIPSHPQDHNVGKHSFRITSPFSSLMVYTGKTSFHCHLASNFLRFNYSRISTGGWFLLRFSYFFLYGFFWVRYQFFKFVSYCCANLISTSPPLPPRKLANERSDHKKKKSWKDSLATGCDI